MISTATLHLLPDIPTLRELTRSVAMLEAIVSPEWEFRYFSFNSRWAEGEMMASMRDGQGDEWFLLFTGRGAILKGLAHESPMARGAPWPGVISDVPPAFAGFLAEPAFSIPDTTFCVWREAGDDGWRRGGVRLPDDPDPDGSRDLLFILDGRPETYREWAEDYYETPVDLSAVEHVYQGRPLTAEVVARLNPALTLEDLAGDVEEIGYPVA